VTQLGTMAASGSLFTTRTHVFSDKASTSLQPKADTFRRSNQHRKLVFKWLIRCNQLLGLAPVQILIDGRGHESVVVTVWSRVLSFIVLSVAFLTLLPVLSLLQFVRENPDQSELVLVVSVLIKVASALLTQCSCQINAKSIAVVASGLLRDDMPYEKFRSINLVCKVQVAILLVTVAVNLALSFGSTFYYKSGFSNGYLAFVVSDHVALLVTLLCEFQFTTGVRIVRVHLDMLYKDVEYQTLCFPLMTDYLNEWRFYWKRYEDITEMARLLNKAFSLQLLLSVCISFLEITTVLYTFLTVETSGLASFFCFYWAGFYGLKLITLLHICQRTHISVSCQRCGVLTRSA